MIKTTIKTLEAIFAASQNAVTASTGTQPTAALPRISSLPISYRPDVLTIRTNPDNLFSKENYARVTKYPYYAYTRIYDEAIVPSELAQPTEIIELHSRM